MKILKKNGDINVTTMVEKQLRQISPSTIDRIFRPLRQKGGRHHFSTTRPGSLLKSAISIRTFADWRKTVPAFGKWIWGGSLWLEH